MVGERRMFAWFAIPTNMLVNILTNILSLERLFECFFSISNVFMAENKNKEGSGESQKKIRWDHEMVDKLIDLCETKPCLWDIADPTYSKRNVKEKALSE